MMRWIVAGLLVSACHQPVPVRPAQLAQGERSASGAGTADNPQHDNSAAAALAVVTQAPDSAPVPVLSFPPDAAVITNDSVQRALVVQQSALELWSSTPPKKIATLLTGEARDISFSPAGDLVAAAVCKTSGVLDCTFTFFRAGDGGTVRTMQVPMLDNAQFSETGRYFLYSSQRGLDIINMATGSVAAHRENGDAKSFSAFGGLENGIEGNASAGWPGVVRVLEDRLVRSSKGLVELTDLITGKVVASHLYKGAGPFAHLLLAEQAILVTFDAASKALFVWRYPPLGVAATPRPVVPKKISLRRVLTTICNDCQLVDLASGKRDGVMLESSEQGFSVMIDLATGTVTRSEALAPKK